MLNPARTAPGSGPKIQRDAAIEQLYVAKKLNTDQIGDEVGLSPTQVLRILKRRGVTVRAPGRPVKYPPVESMGACGAGGCTDPVCDVPPGTCHCGLCRRRENPRTTPIATRHERSRRYVKGKHSLFALGHDVPSEEYRRIQSAAMTAKMNELYADPRRKARWALRRHRSTRLFGYLHRRGYDDEQATLARKIKATYPTLGRATIAAMVSNATGKTMTEKQARSALKPLS